MFNDFYEFLTQALHSGNLPGRSSQVKMAPEPLNQKDPIRKMEAPHHAQASSVLILIFPNDEGRPALILTLRTSHINHGGQLSFPGGRAEEGETQLETALREAREEIGINPQDVQIAGTLSDLYVPHSNSKVSPVVGFIDYEPELTLNPAEVEEAFSVDLKSLAGNKNLTVENWELRQQATYKVPYWDVHRVPLWGATAMILSEFLELYREFRGAK